MANILSAKCRDVRHWLRGHFLALALKTLVLALKVVALASRFLVLALDFALPLPSGTLSGSYM